MTNLQQPTIFSKSELETIQEKIFFEKPLGKIYQTIPFEKLVALFPKKKTKVGAKTWLKPEGCIGLMLLKHLFSLSDEKLIERLNSDWEMQYFCGIQLGLYTQIKDTDLPGRIRRYLGENIDFKKMQDILLESWKPEMQNIEIMLNDATVYESYIRYPTDVKLLWESCTYIYNSIIYICKELQVKLPKSKYSVQSQKQLSYSKCKRKTFKLTNRRKKTLLNLLNRLINQLDNIAIKFQINLPQKVNVVKQIYEQQLYMFENKINKIEDRIISLFKPYLRVMVRGKENKAYEFGAKVTKSQVDGINIIDHLSFDPFNECILFIIYFYHFKRLY